MRDPKQSSWIRLAVAVFLTAAPAATQPPQSGVGLTVPRFETTYVTPVMHKVYAPRQLAESYWQPWYTGDTRYTRQPYTRYVDQLLEGYDFYDVLGSPIGRGWLVYSWTQEQPQARGSQIVKLPFRDVRNTSEPGSSQGLPAYHRFFSRLVIAGDRRGASTYRLMVGDEIYTLFTPLTFFKPRYNGLRLDIAGARHGATLLLSRPSDPNGVTLSATGNTSGNGTNATHLMGGHLDLALGDLARAGLTYVNVHNAHTQLDLNSGNPLAGTLTLLQDQPLRKLWVRLRDDSPGDQQNGAVLLAYDIVLVDTSGHELRGSEIGFLPRIEGGVSRGGALMANGSEQIVLEYDLQALDVDGVRSGDLRSARVELDVANDYRVEVASNLQADGRGSAANIVYVTDARSSGNVGDRSNTGIVNVDYGLPVASEIYGIDFNLPAWHGLSLQGEAALNRRLRRYPNPAVEHQHQIATTAFAGYSQLAWQADPWLLFVETFSIDDEYSTSYQITDPSGLLYYGTPVPHLYEFVDDDDDLDALPEWERPYQLSSEEGIAWPGYDENRDGLNDHNQNGNFIPDYDEPFLRFASDRPQLLPGLDMNYNGTIDRFENDEHPDYPYRTDHRGVHAYLRTMVGPDASVTAGRQRLRLLAGDGRTEAWYLLAVWDWRLPQGRLRLFDHAAAIHDDIPDDLVQWVQPVDARGRMLPLGDDLPARNTWKNVFYADWEQNVGAIRMVHRIKSEWLRQRDGDDALQSREGRRTSGFLGLVNRAQWRIPVGASVLEPRVKSELRRQRPYSQRRAASTSLEAITILLWSQPLMAERGRVGYFPKYGRQLFRTTLELGLEGSRFWMLQGVRDDAEEDFWRWTWIAQLSNRVAYQGYQLVTRTGLRLGGWHFEDGRDQHTNMVFMTINAGLR